MFSWRPCFFVPQEQNSRSPLPCLGVAFIEAGERRARNLVRYDLSLRVLGMWYRTVLSYCLAVSHSYANGLRTVFFLTVALQG